MVVQVDPTNSPKLDTDVITSARFSSPYVAAPDRSLNRKYLRAVHDYTPSPVSTSGSAPSSTSKTIPLRAGDVILVHLTHSNGWADGTVLNSGVRGWLPTNHCETFDHELIRQIFHALTSLWKTCILNEASSPVTNHHGDELQGFVHGVRFLLERSGCLHRQDPLVQNCRQIAKIRKSLLSDLAALVECQKVITSAQANRDDEQFWMPIFEEYVLKAFKVATRSVRFLDVSLREQSKLSQTIHHLHPLRSDLDPSVTSARKQTLAPLSIEPRTTDRQTLIQTNAVLAGPTSDDDMPSAIPVSDDSSRLDSEPRTPWSPTSPRKDQIRAMSKRGTKDPNSALKHLTVAHDRLKNQIAGLLCLPIQSICSSNISRTTKKAIEACDNLIAILLLVSSRAPTVSPGLESATDALVGTTSKLASVAAQIEASSSDNADTILDLARGRSLVKYATTCQSCAKTCVTEAQKLLRRDGDFPILLADISPSAHLRQSSSITPPFYSTGFQPFISADPIHSAQLISPVASPDANQYVLESFSSAFDLPDPKDALLSSTLPGHMSDPFGIDWVDPSLIAANDITNSRPGSSDSADDTRASTGATTPDLEDAGSGTPASQRSPQRRPVITVVTDQGHNSGPTAQLESKSSAGELIQGKDGKILGGTLTALIECMTSENSVPEPSTLRTFFMSFRSFTNPVELANALIERYRCIEADRMASAPTRLRVFNMFRQWLENHWNNEKDAEALSIIRAFALDESIQLLPSARSKLIDLVEKAPTSTGWEPPHLASAFDLDMQRSRSPPKALASSLAPQPLISKAQLSQLLNDKIGLVELEPLEIARQLTLIVSKYYCAVTSEELQPKNLNSKERKSSTVRTLARISTDLANMVTHTILYNEDLKKRSAVLRHWVRIAQCCAELANYDSLMAIVCALNSSTVSRLKRTWAMMAPKQQTAFNELSAIVDTRKNYGALRQKLQASQTPCLPFVGMFLSDLTFVDAGNSNTRTIQCGGDSQGEVKCINFDKHARTVKIIEHFQSFQVPFNLLALPAFHQWLIVQMDKVRRIDGNDIQEAYQQSLRIEPREDHLRTHLAVKMSNKESVSFWKPKVAVLESTKPRIHHVLHKQSSNDSRTKHIGIAA